MLNNCLFVFLLLVLSVLPSMGQQAQTAVPAGPTKIDVAPVKGQNVLGSEVPVKLQLLDAYGNPVSAGNSFNAEVKVQQPSGQTSMYSVYFAPGESSKELSVPIAESGLAKVTVKQREEQLIGSSNFVLVRPAKQQNAQQVTGQKHKASKKTHHKTTTSDKGPGAHLLKIPISGYGQARLVFAALPLPQVPVPSGSDDGGEFVLTVSGEDANGGTRADGKTCARVQIFYLGSQDLQHDIQIWLSPSNGMLDHNLVVIAKGTTSGDACWTSQYPIPAATLTVAATYPQHLNFAPSSNGANPLQVTHKFTDNIIGLEFVNVPRSITIVDSFNLVARFKGPSGPVRLSDKRDVHFSADSAVLDVNPLQTSVAVGGFDSSTILVPRFFGTSTVQVSTPDFQPIMSVIRITWIGVLLTSLLGGLLGGILAWINSQGTLWMRIVTGLIVGLVASWAYVIVGLPKIDAAILHNQLSVFFVALLVGLAGVKGLKPIADKLSLAGF